MKASLGRAALAVLLPLHLLACSPGPGHTSTSPTGTGGAAASSSAQTTSSSGPTGAGGATSSTTGAGGGTGDPTAIASGLSAPAALIVVGSQLFWVEDYGGLCNGTPGCTSTIKTVATTGGTPKVVLTKANLDPNLASDGTSLYFSTTTNHTTSAVFKSGLDGSSPTELVSGAFLAQPSSSVVSSALFFQGGTVYVLGQSPSIVNGIYAVTGSNVTEPVSPSGSLVVDLYAVDATNLYFQLQPIGPQTVDVSTHAGANQTSLVTAAPNESLLWSVPVGDTLYVLSKVEMTGIATVQTVPVAGGAPTTLATFMHTGNQLAADANGVYVDQGSPNAGIYAVSATGTLTLFEPVIDATQRNIVLDAKNVYWFTGLAGSVIPGGGAFLHAKPR